METNMDNTELEKGSVHIIVKVIEYVPNAVLSKTILKKATGNVIAMALSAGEELEEKILPFDTYIQVIDGVCKLSIGGKNYNLHRGEGIIIPAHSSHQFEANEQFKMLSTTIKSGYED